MDYLVVVPSEFVRDAQVPATTDLTDNEFHDVIFNPYDHDNRWVDAESDLFVGIVDANSEAEAIQMAADTYDYDPRILLASALFTPEEKAESFEKICAICDEALSRAGYDVLDGGDDHVIVRDPDADRDYIVKVEEVAS